MKINRKQLRKIILKETRKYNDPRGSIDRTPNIGTSRFGGPRPDHPFYANDYKPSSEVIDIDHETGLGEIPYQGDDSVLGMDGDEDVAELARYHALNNDKDMTLYNDNPDYRFEYDNMVNEGFLSSIFGSGGSKEDAKRARAAEQLKKLKSGEISVKDIGKKEPDDLDLMKQGVDKMMADLGFDAPHDLGDELPQSEETREEKLARLRKMMATNRARGKDAFKNLSTAGYFQGRGMTEGKVKEEEFLQWYYGNEPDYKIDDDWYNFGANYQNNSLDYLLDEDKEEPKKKKKD